MKEIRLKEIELHSGEVLKEALCAIFHTIAFLRSFDSNVEERTEEHIDIKHAVDPAIASALDREISELLGSLQGSLVILGPQLGKTSVVLELSSRSATKSWFLPSSAHAFERWILPLIVNQQQPMSIIEESRGDTKRRTVSPHTATAATTSSASYPKYEHGSDMGVGTLERLRVYTQERLSVLQTVASIIEIANESQDHLPPTPGASAFSSANSASPSALSTAAASNNLQLLVKLTCSTTGGSLTTSLSKLLHLPPGVGEC